MPKLADFRGESLRKLLTCHPKGVYLPIAVSPLSWREFTVRQSVIRLASRVVVAGNLKTW